MSERRHDCASCVLDKIRAEIEQNAYPIVHGVNNHEKGMTLYGILAFKVTTMSLDLDVKRQH